MPLEHIEQPDDWEDPIVAEVHRTRRMIMKEFNNDFDAYFQHLRELEKEAEARGESLVELFLRRLSTRAKSSARLAGHRSPVTGGFGRRPAGRGRGR
jgi:hypothetical protein